VEENMHAIRFTALSTLLAAALAAAPALAAVVGPAGYIYSTQLLGKDTQSCIAAGPGGTFVATGPGFTANAQSIVLARESGDLRLVASGFNSISDCAYDAVADVLYVTDNADNGDFGLGGPFAAQTGDTVFAIPSASTASGLAAPGLELLPPNSIPFAGNVTVDASGNVFVADSAGGGLGSVVKIVGSTPSPFVTAMDYAGGLAFSPTSGNLFAAETLASFNTQIRQFTAAGAAVPPVPFAGPGTGFGTIDLAFNSDGRILASGKFAGDVVSLNATDATSVPFVSGLTYASGIAVDPFTHRVQILSSFSGGPEDKSIHRFTPVDQLVAGTGPVATECLHEAYGLTLVDGKATCTDGSACDSDGIVNDACVFPVGFCLNVDDPDLATCTTGSNITAVAISARPVSSTIASAATRLAVSLPVTGSTCVFSDGYFVPVRITASGQKKDGKATLKVKADAADGRRDTDVIKLVCKPVP
jgi:hypothetical protein